MDESELRAALAESRRVAAALFAAGPLPMWVYDVHTLQFLDVNAAAVERYGFTREEFLAMRITDIRPPEDVPRLIAVANEPRNGLAHSGLWRHCTKSGAELDVEINSHPLQYNGIEAALVVVHDVTERKRTEEALRQSEERYRDLYENANDVIFTADLQGNFTSINAAAERISGYSRADLPQLSMTTVLAPEDVPLARAMIARKLQDNRRTMYEVTLLARDGRRIPVELSTRLIYVAGVPVGIQGIARDITERRRAEEALQVQALHDSLTGLPNRALFHDRTQQALVVGGENGTPLAVLLMDLDRFKEINDTFGHHIGDALLQELGPRLRDVVRPSDTVARLGGDEFAVLLPQTDAGGAAGIAGDILRVIDVPFVVEGQSLDVGASIGIALYPDHGDDANALLQRADVAMYAAKRADGGFTLYAADQDENSPDRLALSADLRRAVQLEQFFLEYQPKVNITTGGVEQVEALVRWQHPRLGLVPPDHFIKLAEHIGLIKQITLWVLNEALRQIVQWNEEGVQFSVAVNLSARNLHDQTLPDTVRELLEQWQVHPRWLRLEITESAITIDPVRAMEIVTRLDQMGVRVAIDDFGTGYSSLASLKRLPVSEIKIDKSFVLGMTSNENDFVIVRSVIDLARNLGMDAVAEGVENAQTWSLLAHMSCNQAQGYYLSRPLTAPDLVAWTRRDRALGR